MSVEPNESALLIAFARAASKAQEIEAFLQEMVIAAEVATDTENRSFEEIAAKIEKLPLGPLRKSSWKWRKWLTHCLRNVTGSLSPDTIQSLGVIQPTAS